MAEALKSGIRQVVIVGGGAAGWITAGLLAAKCGVRRGGPLEISVLEAPDIPIIGVGEGTWPTMRATLRTMGIREADFIRRCHASFKQGSKFCRWRRDDPADFYYHPFDLPEGFHEVNMAHYWRATGASTGGGASFSATVCPQETVCEAHLAPRQATSPDYAGFTNYGYHLDAGAFCDFLREHVTGTLGVAHIADRMTRVVAAENGDIAGVETQANGLLPGDLFIDCTGFRALLLGQHYGVGLVPQSDVLMVDTALAVQAPYEEGDPVQSATVATAQAAGWIWDVSLSTRRGVGYVYSSNHMDEESAVRCVQAYLGRSEQEFSTLTLRKLQIGSGYRETFWHRNCVAVGLSAGFLEPLEASALMLIETAAGLIAEHMPANRAAMDIVGGRFNRRMHHLWDRIIHFLKLHYCLSARDEPFWRDNRSADSLPPRLAEDLALWRHQSPWREDLDGGHEVFPPASYQYVLYGMGYGTAPPPAGLTPAQAAAAKARAETVARNAARLTGMLPGNRALLEQMNGGQRLGG
jgi:hypothetical protein